MPLHNPENHCLPIFSGYDFLLQSIFTRHGGVSAAPYDSLNISFGVNDDQEHVQKNRAIIQNSLRVETIISSRQVHGTKILVLDKGSAKVDEVTETISKSAFGSGSAYESHDGYDAFISNIPGVALMVQQADCQAVMLLDPQKKIVANIHCGWKGSVYNIIGKTVTKMQSQFNVNPQDILAGISPSLGPCCAEFVNYQTELPNTFWQYQVKPTFFNFWDISRDQLQKAGLSSGNIEISSICTVCSQDWFSYRRDKKTGRFCSIIGLI